MELQRPLSTNWNGSLGVTLQRTKCSDEHGHALTADCYGAPLTFSGLPHDTMAVALASTSYR